MAKIQALRKLLTPINEFIHDSRAVGIVLLVCTVISLLLANSGWSNLYINFWNTEVHFTDGLTLPHTILHWINDGLMAVFFFLVGMEIKRELITGELASFSKAVLPLAAALGGMIVPALIFVLFNAGTPYAGGWGIPMATDIAFSLGIASLAGPRFPASLKIFLMALAIVDDLGAILVIALFYGGQLNMMYLAIAGTVLVLFGLLARFKIYHGFMLLVAGLVIWYCIFNSGIHASIAGVLTALLVPLKKLNRLEHMFHDPVNFIILPLFALANTAIIIPTDFAGALTTPLSWGIMSGLLIGKPLGITLFSWIAVKARLGEKPPGASWMQFISMGTLAGIGFTMSIFITMIAFTDAGFQDIGKIAVLLASLISAILGVILVRVSGRLVVN
jgi:Na+:H+ antiporter, NhaA family